MTGAALPVWTLLIRGVNVGGKGRLPMADLRALLTELGAIDPTTFIQSGNAVFSGNLDPAALADRISDGIESRFGFRRHALVLPGAAMVAARDGFPFPPAWESPKTGHVWFLTAPASPDLAAMRALAAPDERFALQDGRFCLHAPNGIGRSKLAEKVERLLGVPATARNLATIRSLAELVEARSPAPI